VTRIVVYDSTALLALFRSQVRAFDFWELADAGRIGIIFPAAAVAEANRFHQETWDAWSVMTWPEQVNVAPLDLTAAVELAGLPGGLAVAHTIWEARQVEGAVLTGRPQDYAGTDVPVLSL
jgi:uncharacterized membrane protein YfbV (UPF0208 family)